MLRRDLFTIDEDAKILFSERRCFGQPHRERAKWTIAGIHKIIGNAEMNTVRSAGGKTNVRLAIFEVKTTSQGMDTSCGKKHIRAQDCGKKNSRPCLRKQDEVILTGRGTRVKIS